MAIDPTPRFQLPRYTNGQDLHPTRTDFNGRMELIDELAAIALQGARADRPMPETRGRFYAATDTRDLFYDTGTTWLEVARIGAGGPGSTVLVGGSTVQADEGTSDRAARADHVHRIPLATANSPGAQSGEDRAKMLAATNVSTPNTHVVRDSEGRTRFADPSAVTDAANKRYVDTLINTRAAASHTHNASDTTGGTFNPARLPPATTSAQGALSPEDKALIDGRRSLNGAGSLVVRDSENRFNSEVPALEYHVANKKYVDQQVGSHRHSAADINSGEFSSARLPAATAGNKGAMSHIHFQLVDGASPNPVGNALPLRTSNGNIAVPAPTASIHATQRSYVDDLYAGTIKDRGQLGSGSIDSVTETGEYYQNQTTPVTIANGYPVNGNAGALSVRQFTNSTSGHRIQVWTQWSSPRQWFRTSNTNGEFSAWQEFVTADQVVHTLPQPLGSTNLNARTEPGDFYVTSSTNASEANHFPPGAAGNEGLLEVKRHIGNSVMQRYTVAIGSHPMWIRRRYVGGTWSDWSRVGA